ncbi:MAG: outer membrane beta-barrel protein [Saprospiraceae bacterium]
MERPIYTIILLVFFSMAVTAQSNFRLGFHGGAYYANVGDGVKFAVTGQSKIYDFISIRPELALVKKPFESELANLEPGKEYNLTSLHGLEIALPAKFTFDFKKWNFFGALGPYGTYAFGMEGYLVKEAGGSNWRKEKIEFENAKLNQWDFGFSIGGGIEKIIANDNIIVLQAFKNWGMLDANLQSNSVSFTENLVLMLGMTFPIGAEE